MYVHTYLKIKENKITTRYKNMIENQNLSFESLLSYINSKVSYNSYGLTNFTTDLVDPEFFEEIKAMDRCGVPIYFGKTMKDIKCVLVDDSNREHALCVKYKGPKKLVVMSSQLPQSLLLEQEYKSIDEVYTNFKKFVHVLSEYFNELERIDRFCTVVEPVNPTFKDHYRRILLDNRVWLHVEVTPEGSATNIHLVGQSDHWQDKLQMGLLKWNHDENIVDNIMDVFGITEFPIAVNTTTSFSGHCGAESMNPSDSLLCSICLCPELKELGVPQPICANTQCAVYFHTVCLFQWLVSSNNGRPPAFGVATGSCPSCMQPISCSEKHS